MVFLNLKLQVGPKFFFVQKFAGHFLTQNTFHSKMTSYGLKGAITKSINC